MRTICGILLIAASLYGGWFLGKQRAERAEANAAAEARSLAGRADGSEIVAAAEAWKRYREKVRLGVSCEGDSGPHPLVVAAALGVVAWYVLRNGMKQPVLGAR
ncbi:MAG: hypothetical protein K8U03_21080 [Planctomycetia bacterium]|nr:hypothetical protein [Planctomycetia bacterium]